MKILALEFSSSQRSVAFLDTGSAGRHCAAEVIEAGGSTFAPLCSIDEALHRAKIRREQVECIAIGLGPGSYTGIRAAIAIAQGWQLARGVKLAGISSVECLAACAQEEQMFGRVTVAIDAQRGELYLASFEISVHSRNEVEPLRLAGRDEAPRLMSVGGSVVGPEADRWIPTGRVLFPAARVLARLAAERQNFVAGETLEPIYLRETTFLKAPPPRERI